MQDTTTPEEREALGMSRQAANTSRLPGMGGMQNRLGMTQAGAVQNARLGAASSADFLAASGAADARRQQGEQALGMQGLQYQNLGVQQLRRDLATASARRQHDLDVYNQNKAALTQGAATNLDNGIGHLASYGAQALDMGIRNKVDKAQVADAEIGEDRLEPNVAGLQRSLPALLDTLPNLVGYTPGKTIGLRQPRYNIGLGSQYTSLGLRKY